MSNMDVSRLAIEVTTKGIDDASRALGGLSRSAGTADKRVDSLTGKLAKLMQAGFSANLGIAGLSNTMALINNAMQSASANATAMAQNLAQATQSLNSMTVSAGQSAGALRTKSHWSGVVTTTLKAMTTAALAYVGVNFMKHSIEAADGWQTMQAKLKIATGSFGNAKVAQQDLFDMSQKLRVPMDAQIKLFTRMAPAMRNNNKSYEETKEVVEGVALALKLNGATAGEASSVMLQFSQSMQKGYLDGAEFNAIAENGSPLMQALSRHFNKATGELKKMGSQAKITREEIQQAIHETIGQWRKDFAELPITVGDGVQRIKNSWMKAMGELSGDTGLNRELVKTLGIIEAMIPAVRDELVAAFNGLFHWINENRNNLSEVWTQVKGIASDVWEIVGAMGAVAKAILGAGDDFSMFGFALFSIRLAVAGLEDGFMLVGGVILKVGGWIYKALVVPLGGIATELLGHLFDGFSGLMDLFAKGADAAGMHGLADNLRSAADFGRDLSKTMGGIQAGSVAVGNALTDQADKTFDMLSNGEGAVQRVLNGEKEITKEQEKRSVLDRKAWEKRNGPQDKKPEDKDAKKAHDKAMRDANSELERTLKLNDELIFQYQLMDKFGTGYEKVTAAQKEQLEIKRKLMTVMDPEARAALNLALYYATLNEQQERNNAAKKAGLDAQIEYGKKQDEAIGQAQKEVESLQDKINGYKQVKGAVEDLALTKAQAALVDMENDSAPEDQISKQRELIKTLKEVATLKAELGQLELGTKLDKFFDDAKVADFGSGFADAFGKAGKAIDKAGKSLDQYKKKIVANGHAQKEVDAITDPSKRAREQERLNKKTLKDDLDMYADMAGAAKDFFKEKTAAYKVFDAFEKGLRIVRLAQDAEEFATKIAQGWAWISEKVSQAFVAMSTDTAVTTASVANSEASAIASTAAGVAKAFEQMGVWGFVGAAAIIAFMATMGVGGGGGASGGGLRAPDGSIETLDQRQKRQGTGTVLGDDTAKSESLQKALDALKDNSNIGLEYTASMASSLRSIEQNIGGLTATVARVNGLTTGLNMGIQTGTQSHGGLGGLFGGKTTTDILDTGLTLKGKLERFFVSQYADVQTTSKSSGFLGIGGKTRTSTNRQTQGVDQDIADYIGAIFGDISNTIAKAGGALGQSTDSIIDKLKAFNIDVEVSLKDLKGKDLEDALNAMFSSTADKMTEQVMPMFKRFQQAGEGMFETVVRVSTGMERAKDALASLGVTMVALDSIDGGAKGVDAELVRSSLIRKESGTSLVKILGLLDGSMEDIVAEYRTLIRLRAQMEKTGLGSNLSLDLIRGAGGLSALASSFDDYFGGFFTEAEQNQLTMMNLRREFARLNMSMPATKDGFKALVQSLMAGGPVSQELAGRVLSLSGSFSDAMDAAKDLAQTAHDDLADKISNAKDALKDSYNNEASALENLRDKMRGFSDGLKEFRDSLITGDLSTKSELEKYQTALATYNDVSGRALNGDQDAIGQFTKVAQDLLQFSRSVNASGDGYTADYERVLAETQALEKFTDLQADSAQTQMDMLKKQVEVLVDLDESVKSVAQAIAELVALPALSSITVPTASAVTAAVFDPGTDATANAMMPSAEASAGVQAAELKKSNDDLLAEIQALRTEVVALRNEQRVQTDAIVGSNMSGPDEAADKLIASQTDLSYLNQQKAKWASNIY